MTQHDHKILIVGGGLGGLALAQGLKRSNVPFHVFERDDSSSWRAQGYRIRIVEEALRKLLPGDLWSEFENTCATLVPGGSQIDALTGSLPLKQQDGGPRRGPPPSLGGKPWNADRTVLRNVLLTDLIESGGISFHKRLVRYELVDGGVVAHFADGSTAKGSMLIGADGSRSLVRRQLVPEYTLLDTEGRAIFGKTPITADLLTQIPSQISQGICIVADMSDGELPMKLFCDTMAFQNRHLARTQLPSDYVYWVLIFQKARTGLSDEIFMSLGQEQSMDKSLEMTSNWHETCRNILNHQRSDSTSPLVFITARSEMPLWPSDVRITLLGDAAHPMTPVGGVGANSAFADAAALLEVLCAGVNVTSLSKYEDKMRSDAKQKIAQSAQGAAHFFGMKSMSELKEQTMWR